MDNPLIDNLTISTAEEKELKPFKDGKVILTKEQQILILKRWETGEPPSILDLYILCFPEIPQNERDSRDVRGRAIKAYLIETKLKVITETEKVKYRDVILSTEQKEYIYNNCSSMGIYEMATELFQNPRLSRASKEVRAIVEYIKTDVPREILYDDLENFEDDTYRPPKKNLHVVARINRYVKDADLSEKKLSPQNKKNCESLISYLHDYRLIHQINTYSTREDKELFESSFISYTWDKSDLSAEDVHLYIAACTEVVMSASIQRTINLLQTEQDRQMEENEGKISMALIEAVNVARTEYNSSVKRQRDLFNILTEERSARLKERIGQNSSLLTLIETWKIKQSRDKMIKMAQERKEKLSKEIDRLETMEDLKCKLLGIGRDEILEG